MPTPLFNELVLMSRPSLMYSFLSLTAVYNSSKELTVVHSAAFAVTPMAGTRESSITSVRSRLVIRFLMFFLPPS